MLIVASLLALLGGAEAAAVPGSLDRSPPAPARWSIGVEGMLDAAPALRGSDRSVALPAITLLRTLGPRWGLQGSIAAGWSYEATAVPVAARDHVISLHTGLRALWWPWSGQSARLGLAFGGGYRATLGGVDVEGQTTSLRRHGAFASVALRPEWFPAPRLSLHTQLGLAYGVDDDDTGAWRHGVRLAGNVLGQAGVSFWF